MGHDMPPFGACDDEDVSTALEWLLNFIDPQDWANRVKQIESKLDRASTIASTAEVQFFEPLSFSEDQSAWYLYLADTALHAPLKYEPEAGSRVLPIFKRLGSELDLLRSIGGIERRVAKMLTTDKRQPDSALFEMLVALLWRRNGYTDVHFIPESPDRKNADIHAATNKNAWFVECKRLQKSSEYSELESRQWLKMWRPFGHFLYENRYSIVLDILFHVELSKIADSFLMEHLAPKLRFVRFPCELIKNETWTVTAKRVDTVAIQHHLLKYRVRYQSSQLNELIGGRRDPNRGFSVILQGSIVRIGDHGGSNCFVDDLVFAAGAFWSCDAARAIERKARDIRGHLASAVEQLPDEEKCVVHVGLETLDGKTVEMTRLDRILTTVATFDSRGKDLRWIYCHQFQSYAPPTEAWTFDETVHNFGRSTEGAREPLKIRSAVVPDDTVDSRMGVHWLRPPP